ncbi:acyl-CoA dehydrogenase family protein [Polymorphospora sp. NPDC051019]|uniref:acyl-CoA dehydrogenase family protein n=1 Tax=Polymorphospora sp. NPDC051019 TaxID=3155725 RepID=UPI00343D39E7
MNLDDAPAQAELRARARAWLAAHAAPRTPASVDRADDDAAVARGRAWQRTKFEAGWAGLTWPRPFGGAGRPLIDQIVWDQEAARFDVPEETFIVSTMLAGPTIIDAGTDEQRARHLPPMLDGRAVWCQLFSEPAAGSDLAGVTTRAVRAGDGWVVTGQKVWNSGAHYADWGLLLVRTDPAAPKHAGMSYLLLDMRSPGITVRPIRQITGAEHFNEVFLDEVYVPDSELLGAPGDGWRIARLTLAHEREGLVVRRRVDVDAFLELVRSARIDGEPAAGRADVRQQVAEIWMRAQALELLSNRVTTSIARGRAPGAEGSVGKLLGAALVNRVGRLSLSLQGADGLLDGPEALDGGRWQHAFLDAAARRIAGGSDEIQRDIISERVLGLPREPRVTKDARTS